MLRLSPSLSHCFVMQTVHLAQRALKCAALLMRQALLFGLHKSLSSLWNCERCRLDPLPPLLADCFCSFFNA